MGLIFTREPFLITQRSSFYLYPDFPFCWRIKMQIKRKKTDRVEKTPKMLSVLMAFETLPMMHLFIREIQIEIEIESWKPKSNVNFILSVLTRGKWMFAPQCAVVQTSASTCTEHVCQQLAGTAAVFTRLHYKTQTAALHTVSRFCPRVKLPFHNFHYIWSSGWGLGRGERCAAR